MSTLNNWDEIYTSQEWGKYPPLALVRFIARRFYQEPNRKQIKILELGSGPGANLWYIAREGFMAYGIDGSSIANEQARARLTQEGLADQIGALETGNYQNIPFDNNYFDAIIDVASLYCNSFHDTEKIINSAFDKLKPGGFLFSITFNQGTWGTDTEECDYHAVNPQEGPGAGNGYFRFTTREDIDKLYLGPSRTLCNLESCERRLMLHDVSIKEWIIEVQKDYDQQKVL